MNRTRPGRVDISIVPFLAATQSPSLSEGNFAESRFCGVERPQCDECLSQPHPPRRPGGSSSRGCAGLGQRHHRPRRLATDPDDRPPRARSRQLPERRPDAVAGRVGCDQRPGSEQIRPAGQVPDSLRRGRSGHLRPYDGPPLAWLVKACKAPDGSYWALQSWQRLKPNYGGTRGAWELHLSHWRGAPAQLVIYQNWAYGRYRHFPAGSRIGVAASTDTRPPVPARRSTATGGTSTSTPSTPPTARAGTARTASSRTIADTPWATSVWLLPALGASERRGNEVPSYRRGPRRDARRDVGGGRHRSLRRDRSAADAVAREELGRPEMPHLTTA